MFKSIITRCIVTACFFSFVTAAFSSPMKTLRNFDEPSKEPEWFAQNDGVMGGVSTGWAETKAGHLHFSGKLSLENNGGFAQIYSQAEQADFSRYTGLRLRVKGDGRDYQFRIATDARYRGSQIAYRATFPTKADQWTEVTIPFSTFVPSYRGYILPGPVLELTSIRQIALLLADGNPGSFSLLVDWIRFEAEAE